MLDFNNVLIIDDDELTSQLTLEILTSAGYKGDICCNPKTCKKIINSKIYDIYIIDLRLENVDGISIIETLRNKFPQSIIITITGLDANEYRINAMKAGADHFFNKPVNAEKLINKIAELKNKILDTNLNFDLCKMLTKAFNFSSNPVFITDKNGNLFYGNKHFLELCGLSAARITRYNLYSLHFENSLEFDQLIKKRNYKHLDNRFIESRFVSAKSKEVWFSVIINPVILDDNPQNVFFLFQLFDITKKKQMDNFIISNEEKFRSFISLSNDGMALINEDGLVIEWNESMTKITGVKMEEVYGEKFWDILQWVKIEFDDNEMNHNLEKNIKYILKKGMPSHNRFNNVCRINHKDGHIVFIQFSSFTIKMDSGYRLGIVVRDNTNTVMSQRKIAAQNEELSQAYLKMEKLARIDPLTQLPNRRDIEVKLDYEKSRVARQKHALSIAIADIDDFKKLNDHYGHDMGDFVLKEIAALMKKTIREQDIIGRWGGEEFILIFPETPLPGGKIICERLRQRIEKFTFKSKKHNLKISITIGLSQFIRGEDVYETIKRADIALYKGKNNGKNQVEEFEGV